MLDGFKKISLITGNPFVSVTENGLTFNKNVVAKMDKPSYVIFMINKETKQFAIQKCDGDCDEAAPFVKNESKVKYGVRFNNKDLLQSLSDLMDWNFKTVNYRIDGKYIEEEKAMIFDLNEAREISKKNMVKK